MEEIIEILNKNYPISFDRIEFMRDMGSTSYTAFSGSNKYFLRVIKPALFNTAVTGTDIQVFLQNQGFPVPPIILTNEHLPYVRKADRLLILYEFIEGNDSDPEQDVEAIGALVGRLHQAMKAYPGELVKHDKHFYIGRYIEILQKKQYPKIDEYIVYGDALWEKIKDLPRGYCHGDMYGGLKMAHGRKCYCCGKNATSDTHYYCYECIKKLEMIFDNNCADFCDECFEILENPHWSYHCISCGEFENRRIIAVKCICNKCVMEELLAYEQENN